MTGKLLREARNVKGEKSGLTWKTRDRWSLLEVIPAEEKNGIDAITVLLWTNICMHASTQHRVMLSGEPQEDFQAYWKIGL